MIPECIEARAALGRAADEERITCRPGKGSCSVQTTSLNSVHSQRILSHRSVARSFYIPVPTTPLVNFAEQTSEPTHSLLSALVTNRSRNGSGRRYGTKRRVEQRISLACSWMLQHNYFDVRVGYTSYNPITWSDSRKDAVYTLETDLERGSLAQMRLHLRNTRQDVYLHPTSLHFGGSPLVVLLSGMPAPLREPIPSARLRFPLPHLSRSYLSELHRGQIDDCVPSVHGPGLWSHFSGA